MTQRTGRSTSAADTNFERVWEVPDAQVASGRIPGYVAALGPGGEAPMGEDTLFRLASVTKPIGVALTLSLVQDGARTLGDPIARWLPEAASPLPRSARLTNGAGRDS
jgi:CubicO group peptidase (beta-lactamase class C family)